MKTPELTKGNVVLGLSALGAISTAIATNLQAWDGNSKAGFFLSCAAIVYKYFDGHAQVKTAQIQADINKQFLVQTPPPADK